jgi:hypothetical protein
MGAMRNILTRDSSRESADLAAETASENTDYFSELIDLSRFSKSPLNWRSLRAVELCDIRNPELIKPYINILAEEFPQYNIDGLNRILPKIFSNHINDLSEESLGTIADKCFKILLNPKHALAVLVNAMQFLFDLTKSYPDLKPELYVVVEQLLSEKGNSAAIKSKAKRILKDLDFESFRKL